MGKNVAILGVDVSSSVHVDNKKNDILILGIGPTQVLHDNTLAAKAQYSVNLSRSNRNIFEACIILVAAVFYFLMLQKYINSKQKSKRF